MRNKYRAWDGLRMTTSGIMFNSTTGELETPNGTNMVLMQCTSLKDKNGKEIYEGDIIEFTQHHFNTEMTRKKRKIVQWNCDRWNVYSSNAGESNVVVIGNKYENPELKNTDLK